MSLIVDEHPVRVLGVVCDQMKGEVAEMLYARVVQDAFRGH
jgi:hypothetical protein